MPFTAFTFGEETESAVEEVSYSPDKCKESVFIMADAFAEVIIFKFRIAKVADIIPVIVNMPIGFKVTLFVTFDEFFTFVAEKTFCIAMLGAV